MDLLSKALGLPQVFSTVGVVPVLVGPLNALFAAAPGIALALFGLAITLFKPKTMKRLLQLFWSQKIAVVLMIGAMVGLYYGYKALFPRRADAHSVMVGADKTSWLAFRGGPARRAFIAEDFAHGKEFEDPAHGKINWSFTDDSIQTFYSSAAVVGNRVYITGSRYGSGSDIGGIYSIDADTGKLVWAFHGDGYRSTFSSPAVWGKYLVVGEGLHETKDSRIFCIDIAASEKAHEGVKLWDYRTTSHMESSPCIDTLNHQTMIGGADDGVYCFKLDPDANGKAQKVWQLPGKDYPDCETSPVVVDDKVYFGLGREVHAMCCADAKTGAPIWRVPTPYSTASPAVANGKLYFGMGVGDFVNSAADLHAQKEKELQGPGKKITPELQAELDSLKSAGQVWCIDLATHKVDWKVDTGETVLGAPAVDDNCVYAGAYNGRVFCISTEGPDKLLRTFDVHEPIVCGPAVGNRHVYVSTLGGTLYALDKNSMTRVWRVALNKATFSSPTVGDGHVYLGTTDGGFLCLGVPGREIEETIWPGAMGGMAGSTDSSRIMAVGSYGWSSEAAEDDDNPAPPNVILSPAAAIGNSFYVGVRRKDANGVAAFDCGDEIAKKPTPGWFAPAKLPVTLSPAANGRCVYFVDGKLGDPDRLLHCVDRKTGSPLWTRPIESAASGQFIITADNLFIADSTTHLSCLNIARDAPTATANELWQADIGDCIGAPAVADDMLAVAVKSPPRLLVLDAKTHQTLWSQALPDPPQTSPVISHNHVWIGDAQGIHGYSLLHNEPPRVIDCGPVSSPIAADTDHLACITDAGHIIVITAETGAVSPPIEGAVPTVPPILVDNSLLYYTKDAINVLDLRSNQTALWSKIAATWPGTITTPMIMVNSHLFFGTDKRGFVCMKPKKG